MLHGRVGVGDILGDCGSPDPGSIPGPGPFQKVQYLKTTFKLLIHKAKEMNKLLKEEEFLSEYKFSEVRQAFKDQIEQELENAKKQMDGFMAHNPEKVLKA